jgi:hypothetical protein
MYAVSDSSTSAWNWNFKLVLFLFRTGGFGKDLFSKHKRYQAS